MFSLVSALVAVLALPGAAVGPGAKHVSAKHVSFLDRGAIHRGADDSAILGVEDLDALEDKPKRRISTKVPRKKESLTDDLDQIIPILEYDFKYKTQQLRVALAWFKEKQRSMDVAKREATEAMKLLRKEAEKRRKLAAERKSAKERERRAKEEAKRTAKDAMVKKAQALMGAKGGTEMEGLLGSVGLGIMVDVLMALPGAVENPIFLKRLNKSKNDIVVSVQDFLNITRRKTAKFVLASSKASDVELSFLMARYFHEASFRVKAMQSDAEKIARDLNVVMPKELRKSFLPIVKQISSLMGNISDYNNKLSSMHTALHNVWQISELMLPHMSRIYPMKTIVVDTVKDFMSLATVQVAGLQESADEIVTNVGPVIAERMQCQFSAAPTRSSLGLFAMMVALAGYLFD